MMIQKSFYILYLLLIVSSTIVSTENFQRSWILFKVGILDIDAVRLAIQHNNTFEF